jgi:hypothetical protein
MPPKKSAAKSALPKFNIENNLVSLIRKLNHCINNWYKKYKDDVNIEEFTACCDEKEEKMLIKCFKLFMSNIDTQKNNDIHVLIALIVYYYSTQVLEYYVNNYRDVGNTENPFVRELYRDIASCFKEIETLKSKEYLRMLIVSDEPYISTIRRTILNMNEVPFTGGKKHNRKSKKHCQKKRKGRKCRPKSRKYRKY